MQRQTVSTGNIWERTAGYSRAIRVGNFVAVAGTTATDVAGNILAQGDPYEQTLQILKKIEAALQEVQAQLADVVRTRIYLTNMEDWQAVAKAHHEIFHAIRPANTLVEVSRLATPDMLVEIDVDAIVPDA